MDLRALPQLLWQQIADPKLAGSENGWSRSLVRAIACIDVLLGLAVLLAWHSGLLSTEGTVVMKPNTALAFVLFGVSLGISGFLPPLRLRALGAKTIAGAVGLLALLTIMEYAASVSLGIDRLAFPGASASDPETAIRMGLNTALCLVLLSVALLLTGPGRTFRCVVAQVCVFVTFWFSMAALLGYLLGVEALTAVASYTVMSLPSAVGLLLTCLGTLLLQPRRGLMPIFSNAEVSGRVVRRLLACVFVVTPLLAFLLLGGEQLGWYGADYGLAIFALSQLLALTVVIWSTGGLLLRSDHERSRAERAQQDLLQQLRNSAQGLEHEVARRTADLRTSEARLRLITDSSTGCIGYIDAAERFHFANQTYHDWYGLDHAALLGKTIREVIGDPGYAEVEHHYKLAISGTRTRYTRTLQRSPAPREIAVDLIPDIGADGKIAGVFVSGADVTARRQHERALQESEERFRSAFDFAPIGMAIVSLDGRWLKVNHAICEIVGYPEAQLLSMTFQQITHPGDLDKDLDFVHRLIAGEMRSYQMEKRYIRKEGDVVTVLLSVSLVRSPEDAPLHFISQIQDISARREAEEAMRESEERFQLVVSGTHDGIWDWNVETGYCYYSPRYCELLGYGENQLQPVRGTFDLLLHPADRERTMEALRTHFEKRVPYDVEYRLRHKSGEYCWFHARGQASWSAQGEPVRFTGALRDITERKQAEQQLAKTTAILSRTGRLAKIGGWERDLTTNIPVWSDEVREIVEVDASFEPTLDNVHRFYAPEARPVLQAAVNATVEDGTPFELDLPYLTATGRKIWVRVQGNAEMRDGKAVRIFGTLQDITDRKNADLAVERSRRFLDAVIEAIPQPVSVKDREHRWVLFNSSFCDLMGLPREQLLGKSDSDIHAPDLVERYWAEDEQALSMDTPLLVESQLQRADGSHVWLLRSKRRVDVSGDEYIVGVGTDITRLKQIQQELLRSEELHRLLADNSSDMITRLSPLGAIAYASPASAVLLGYQAEELRGQPVPDYMHPEDAEQAIERFKEVVRDNAPKVVTCRLRHKENRWIWVETSFRAVREAGSRWTTQVIGVSRNVDERVRVSDALNRFKYVLDNTLDMIFIYDADSLRFSYVNLGAAEALGYPREKLIGMRPWEVRADLDEAQYRRWIAPMLRGETVSRQLEAVFRRADGSTFPVDATMQILHRSDEVPTFIAVIRDATERKKIERMKNEFVSTVSHELRTPLTSIRGSLGLIAGGAAGALPEQARNLIRIAHTNSERLVRLINDILDIEKIESGGMRFDMQPHALRPLLEHAVETNRAYAEQYGVHLELDPDMPSLQIKVDADRFQQVMANLLSNACKFSATGSSIEIRAKLQGVMAQVSVTDRGPGIPVDFRHKIFGKFSQADASDSRQKGGTGLGLSIVKTIVEKHGGLVTFDTQLGVGTTFHVMFPLVSASRERARGAAAADSARAPLRILICEDDPAVASAISVIVEAAGFESEVAASLSEARARLATDSYTAMTLDLHLPDGDGVDLLRELRAAPATRQLPVVVVSVDVASGRVRFNGGAMPRIGWVSKPVDHDKLLEVLRDTMRTTTQARPRILHVEDDPDVRHVVATIAADLADFDPAGSLADARRMLQDQAYSLVVLDLELPDGSGWELLADLNRLAVAAPVVLFSASEAAAPRRNGVAATLTKTHTTNEALLSVIAGLLRREGRTSAVK